MQPSIAEDSSLKHEECTAEEPPSAPKNESQVPGVHSLSQPLTRIPLYPLSNYTVGTKDAQPEEDHSVPARLQRLQEDNEKHGMRRSVEAVIIVHDHHHPHVLMLQIGNAFFKLPGDYLSPDQTDYCAGLKEKLNMKLCPERKTEGGIIYDDGDDWIIGECLGQWWRPNVETFFYPYVPAHITKPKENRKVFLVHLPPRKTLAVPRNMKLLAVPLMEFYENTSRFGNQLAAIPHLLSRFEFEYR